VEGQDRLGEAVTVVPDAFGEGFRKVLGEIVGDVGQRADAANIDDPGVTGCCVPCLAEAVLREEVTFPEDVKVGVPLLSLGVVRGLQDGQPAADVIPPEAGASKTGEAVEEVVKGVGQGDVAGLDG
jgi:hypothetical protein